MTNNCRKWHFVQLGLDDSLFAPDGNSESLQRQLAYGRTLEAMRPGSRMTVIVLSQKQGLRSFQLNSVTFVPVRQRWGAAKLLDWLNLYTYLAKLDRNQRIDVLTTQSIYDEALVALWFARRYRRPIIGQIHLDIFSPHARSALCRGLGGPVRYWALLAGIRYFTALRVVGEGIARQIRRRGLHSRVYVSPVPMSMLGETLSSKARVETSKKVLFVGRLVQEKNLHVWIRVAELVCQIVQDVTFEVVGEGVLRRDLQAEVRKSGLNGRIVFRGELSYDRLPEIYQSASVFLITSLFEGFGRVVAEALSQEVPVVASQIVGIEDVVVHGKSGFLHPPTDVAGMADSVARLLRDSKLAQSMGQWGAQDVKRRFNPESLSYRWMEILAEYAQ